MFSTARGNSPNCLHTHTHTHTLSDWTAAAAPSTNKGKSALLLQHLFISLTDTHTHTHSQSAYIMQACHRGDRTHHISLSMTHPLLLCSVSPSLPVRAPVAFTAEQGDSSVSTHTHTHTNTHAHAHTHAHTPFSSQLEKW